MLRLTTYLSSPLIHAMAEHTNIQLDPYVRKQNAKLVQVIQNFFTKLVQIVLQARSLPDSSSDDKLNKWFNLHLYASDAVKDDLRLWKSASDLAALPPMIIETYLDLRQVHPRDIVTLKDDNGNPWSVTKGGSKKHEVVLERWLIEFDRADVSGSVIDELPLIYKQAIILFRSLYAYARLMPAYKLNKACRQSKSKNLSLSLGNKILDGKQPISSKGRIGLSKSIIPHQMLTTESHIAHKHFTPIQTTLGTLKVSIAYRNHHNFVINDNEEMLSNHFLNMDYGSKQDTDVPKGTSAHKHSLELLTDMQPAKSKESVLDSLLEELDKLESVAFAKEPSVASLPKADAEKPSKDEISSLKKSAASLSISPCSSTHHSDSPGPTPTKKIEKVQRPSIQPFKIGSIGNSPPPGGHPMGSSLERRISITSNKSTSNASLAALLRNPRSSTLSSNTPNNIPIVNSTSNAGLNFTASFPRSISSSHGSAFHGDEQGFSNPESANNTPRFSLSFGSRAGRRFSNASGRHSTPMQDTNPLLLGTLVGLASLDTPSGLYIDDGISDFVRMIDSKLDLRFTADSGSKLVSSHGSSTQLDALTRFQSLKSQHQQLGDSVSASVVMHQGSGRSSRKSSHSMYSPPPSLPLGSYDNAHMPSINSRLKEATPPSDANGGHSDHDGGSIRSGSSRKDSFHSNTSFLKGSVPRAAATAVTSTANVHAHGSVRRTSGSLEKKAESVVSGLATTPSAYSNKPQVHYENVFDDEEDGEDFYLASEQADKKTAAHEEDDEDLLFTMSDMNVTKN